MASNPLRYYINNELVSIKNIIKYLHCLYFYGIIPKYQLNITETELLITIIYSISTTDLQLSGYTVISYNIYTKKWRGSINNASIVDGRFVDKTFTNLQRDFPFVINNNLLKINYQQPYIEYIIESHHIEDVLEPSLNNFNHPSSSSVRMEHYILHPITPIDPRNIMCNPLINMDLHNYLKYTLKINQEEIDNYYHKIDLHEKYLGFVDLKKIINQNYFLPDELWQNIYKYY